VTDQRYELVIAPTAKKQPAEQLPDSVAFAAHEFII
jgi:mRNA interferase RelE/StbE